jgi:nitrate/nitrite-specific signal transduction histidine kinase
VNAFKHGRASHARILVNTNGPDLTLTVEDNGAGFDSGQSEISESHTYGLPGLRDMARSMGGRLSVNSTPGTGARVEVSLPLASLLPHGDAYNPVLVSSSFNETAKSRKTATAVQHESEGK